MMKSQYLKVFTIFSYFQLSVGKTIDTIEEEAVAEVNDNQENAADGVDYINRAVKGEKNPGRPEILIFTAPYKLCEGGCKDGDGRNIAIQFPLFIGRKGRKAYQRLYDRDFNILHAAKEFAPFKKRTTRFTTTTTPCIILKVATTMPTTSESTTTTSEITTTTSESTTTTSDSTTTTSSTTSSTTTTTTTTTTPTTPTTEPTTCPPVMQCPYYPPDTCLKKRKKKNSTTVTPSKEANTNLNDYMEVTTVTVVDGEAPLRMELNDMKSLEDTVSDYNFYDFL